MITDFSNDFFHFHDTGKACKITINNSFLDYSQFSQCSDLREIASNRDFIVTGRSSIEAYFYLGFTLAHWNAASITGIGANQNDEQFRINLQHALPFERKKWLCYHTDSEGKNVIEIRRPDSEASCWTSEDLQLSIPSQLSHLNNGSLHLTGRGSVWMYMQLGISAALAGIKNIYISKPILPYDIHIDSNMNCKIHLRSKSSKNGIIIGILGNPNSGKSVFSRNFAITVNNVLLNDFSTWIYDCDLASPTPEWFLSDCEGTNEFRKAIKRPWTSKLENEVVCNLKVLRKNLDLVIADMPGGKREDDGRINHIPSPSRANMMSECDAFIVLCKNERHNEIFEDWRHALSPYRLDDRIVAKIISVAPQDNVSISPIRRDGNGLFLTTISGLDRNKPRSEIVSKMREGLKDLIDYLFSLRQAQRKE